MGSVDQKYTFQGQNPHQLGITLIGYLTVVSKVHRVSISPCLAKQEGVDSSIIIPIFSNNIHQVF